MPTETQPSLVHPQESGPQSHPREEHRLVWQRSRRLCPREDQFVHYSYPAEGCSRIHMVWTDSPSWITCWNAGNDYVRAMKDPDIEFMMCQHPWLENDALLADLILPVNTKLEEEDIGAEHGSGQFQVCSCTSASASNPWANP